MRLHFFNSAVIANSKMEYFCTFRWSHCMTATFPLWLFSEDSYIVRNGVYPILPFGIVTCPFFQQPLSKLLYTWGLKKAPFSGGASLCSVGRYREYLLGEVGGKGSGDGHEWWWWWWWWRWLEQRILWCKMFRLYLSTILPTPWYCQYLTYTHSDTVILTGQWQLWGYAMLMSTNEDKTVVHGCCYLSDIAVCMCNQGFC